MDANDEAQAINAMAIGVRNYVAPFKYPSGTANFFGTGINSNSAVNTFATIGGLGGQYQGFNLPWLTNGSNLALPSSAFNSQGQAQIQRGLQIAALQLQVAQLQLQVIQLQTANANSSPQRITK
jgi:hypothetical protein